MVLTILTLPGVARSLDGHVPRRRARRDSIQTGRVSQELAIRRLTAASPFEPHALPGRHLEKDVFVLGVANEEGPLPVALGHYELESLPAGLHGKERRGSVIVLP